MSTEQYALGVDSDTLLNDISSALLDRVITLPSNYTKYEWEYTCVSLRSYGDRYVLVLGNALQYLNDGDICFKLSCSSPSHHVSITKEEHAAIREHINWMDEVDLTTTTIVMVD